MQPPHQILGPALRRYASRESTDLDDWSSWNVSLFTGSRPSLMVGGAEWSRAAILGERSSSEPAAAELSPVLWRNYVGLETCIGHMLSPLREPLPQLTGVPPAPVVRPSVHDTPVGGLLFG